MGEKGEKMDAFVRNALPFLFDLAIIIDRYSVLCLQYLPE